MQTLICVGDLQYALHFKLSKEKKKGLKRKQHAAAKLKQYIHLKGCALFDYFLRGNR